MELIRGSEELEKLNKELNDPALLAEYRRPYDNYRPSFLPRLLGQSLVWWGNVVYGKTPSYLKFRAVEVIARVPYHSWASAAYTLLTLFYSNEEKAMRLSTVACYARMAGDNETMHVVVISQLAKKEMAAGFFRYTLIPVLFSFLYFWWSYLLYLVNPRYSYELNYMFESHAFDQYQRFLELHEEDLKKKPMRSDFLDWYGRHPISQYEFFLSVRNDEIIHRNSSLHELQ